MGTSFECSLTDLQHRMCALPRIGHDFCSIWAGLKMSSVAMLIMSSTGLLVHGLGAGFVYYYWNVQSLKKTRQWITFFMVFSPSMYTVALGQYVYFSWALSEFPP